MPRRYQVALSFAGEDRAYVEDVAAALDKAGVGHFYDRDHQVELWGRHLTEELPRIYAEAAVVVLFVSAAYKEKTWTHVERRAVLLKAAENPDVVVLLPVRFDDTTLPGLQTDVVALDARTTTPGELAERIVRKLVDLGVVAAAQPPPTPAAIAVSNLPTGALGFAGRTAELTALATALSSRSKKPIAALHGMGGVGKTQLAIRYAELHAADYDVVWWVNAEQAALVADQLAALAGTLGLASTGAGAGDAKAALAALSERDRWLLVFDNAERPADVRPWLPKGRGHVLVTSRHRAWGSYAQTIEVTALDADESAALLRERLPDLDDDAAGSLADELGGLPLALAQVAGYLEETGLPPDRWLAKFRSRREDFLDRGEDLDYGGNLASAFSLSLEALASRSPASRQLLTLAAFFGPDPIPLALFRDHPDLLPAPLAAAARGAPAEDLDDVVAAAHAYSMLTRVGDTIQVHRMIQAAARVGLAEQERTRSAATVRELLVAARPTTEYDDPAGWPAWAALAPHVLAVVSPAGADADARRLLITTCWYLWHRTDLDAARALADDLQRTWTAELGADDLDTITANHAVGLVLESLERPAGASIRYRDVLERRTRLLGPYDPDTLIAAKDLADAYSKLQRLDEARPLAEDTLARRRQVLGPDNSYTLSSAMQLAYILASSGDETGLPLAQEALDRSRRLRGPSHHGTLSLMANMVTMLGELDRYEEARDLAADGLARARAALGDDDFTTLEFSVGLGESLLRLGDLHGARPLLNAVFLWYARTGGFESPSSIEAGQLLIEVLAALGQQPAARHVQSMLPRERSKPGSGQSTRRPGPRGKRGGSGRHPRR